MVVFLNLAPPIAVFVQQFPRYCHTHLNVMLLGELFPNLLR
jgi:hypothetical protein